MKVLIIDDSSIMRMMIRNLLKQVDLPDTVEAGDGLEGLAALGRERVDLIMLDMHMPKMDGLEFLQHLQGTPWRDIPVIVVSSDSDTDRMWKAQSLGACAYVTKPFRIEGLREALSVAAPTAG